MLPHDQAADYNQAIMDFGATVCKPLPECGKCFFVRHCLAYRNSCESVLPVKLKKLKIRERWFHYIIPQHENSFAIRKRTGRDIWENLYEFLLVEKSEKLNEVQLLNEVQSRYGINGYKIISSENHTTQKLTHQLVHFSFIHLLLNDKSSQIILSPKPCLTI
jgi:A/G-specific adenine glycosylase